MKTNDPLIGRTINEKYLILEKIGAGGQSKVYKAKELHLNREVALKCIVEDIDIESDQARRFNQEAQDLARLRHPNVVTVFESGNDGDVFYIAMEYLEGLNLSQMVRQNGPLDEKTTLAYMAPLADALDHIHSSDLLHSDVKSSNIIINKDGRPVLMDLGIAIQTDKTVLDGGGVLGTPEYMSPEQSMGEAVDERTDLYSLGVVMYECLTGKVPFHGKNYAATTHMVINQEPVPPKQWINSLSDFTNDLILKMLEKDKENRIGTAPELSGILKQEILSPSVKRTTQKSRSGKAKKVNKPGSAQRQGHKKRNRLIALLIILLALLILIPAGLWYTGVLENNPSPVLLEYMSPEEFQAYSDTANTFYSIGEYVLALRYYSFIRQKADDSESIKVNYLAAREKVMGQLLGQIDLIPLPQGSFEMGKNTPPGDHAPEHQVHISAFSISATEVTMESYLQFLNAFNCNQSGYIGQVKVFLPDHPGLSEPKSLVTVENNFFALMGQEGVPAFGVTWEGAKMFCEFLGGRLPTEAEWEFAALASSSLNFSGSDTANIAGWFAGNTKYVRPVGEKNPNGMGIYDMSGNVWEWCSDYYARNYYQRSGVENPSGPDQGNERVIRGGDILSDENLMSNKYRSFQTENSLTNDYIGFRLCK